MKVIALALLVAHASAAPLLVVKEGERQVYAPSTKQTYVDAGAACSEYGKVLKVTVAGDHKEVRLDRPGTYKITYSCTGSSAVTKTRVVIVNDFKPVKFGQAATFDKELGRPVLTINEGKRQYYQQELPNSKRHYIDAGAHCTYNGKDVSHRVSIAGDVVRLHVQGIYKITYNCQTRDGNTAIPMMREVLVGPRVDDFRKPNKPGFVNFQGGNDWNQEKKRLHDETEDVRIAADKKALADMKIPVIKLNGKQNVQLEVSSRDEYHDEGATCFFQGKDVTTTTVTDKFGNKSVKWNLTPHGNAINLRTQGNFQVIYHCKFQGKTAHKVVRTITVVSPEVLGCTSMGKYVNKQSKCVKCEAGKFGAMVTSQVAGFPKVRGCKPCPNGSVQPGTGRTSCIKLPRYKICRKTGYFTSAITGKCQKCKAFTYEKNGACVACPRGQWSKDGSKSCRHSECPPGSKQLANGTCEKCGAGKYQSLGYEAGKNNDQWGRSFCFDCPEGTFNFLTGQKQCVSGRKCAPGTYVVRSGAGNAFKCEKCPIGYAQDKPAMTSCKRCDAKKGEYAPVQGLAHCVHSKCTPGYYSRQFAKSQATLKVIIQAQMDAGQSAMHANENLILSHHDNVNNPHDQYELCSKCTQNTFAEHAGQPQCTACPKGTFSGFGWAKCEQTTCGAGTYEKAWTIKSTGHKYSRCVECPVNTFWGEKVASNKCTPCPSGYYTSEEGSTKCRKILCPAGYRQDVRYAQKKCLPCKPGTWANRPTLTCKPCVGDRWTFKHASTSCSLATSCAVGTHWDSKLKRCVQCAVGRYADEPNSKECKACKVGRYQFNKGQNTCNKVTCGAGKFMSSLWGRCMECSAGTYSATGGLTYCYKCARGKYTYELGATQCKQSNCKAGTYQSRMAVPLPGTDGKNGKTTTCHRCPVNTYQPMDAMFYCFKCPQGKFTHFAGSQRCTEKKECYKTHNGVFCVNSRRRQMNKSKVYKCKNVKCSLVGPSAHKRMAVTHVPGAAIDGGHQKVFINNEPAEAEIMKWAQKNGYDKENFYTAHHICKSKYRFSSKTSEQAKRDDCECFCW